MSDQQASEVEELERIYADASKDPIQISYGVIKSITKSFAQVIGNGAFGVVYLGALKNGMVAVKKLSLSTKDLSEKQFLEEVKCLMRVKHPNIVRFLGYCAEWHGEVMEIDGKLMIADVPQRLLCFEYVPNGSLHDYLQEKPYGFEWNIRYQILKGICVGLHYLHQKFIYHLDLKPGNVLLGTHMEPKITDFGLSRCIDENQSTICTVNLFGTPGYIAPELIDKKKISFKSDIFSLGIIMAKLLTGSNGSFTENWHESLNTDCQQMNRCIEVAKNCVKYEPYERPTIADIVHKLNETETTILKVPQVVNEPRNDPSSSLYQVVKRFKALSIQTLHEYSGMENMDTEFDLLESIIGGNKDPSNLKLPFLQFITKNFSDELKIGIGGSAVLYKGFLRNQIVAVKRLFNRSTINDKMFHRELKSMMTVNHENVVRFLGYCSFTEERALKLEGELIIAEVRERLFCFEYLINGSLQSYLTDELRGLEWQIRYRIIKGICDGLHHLHSEKHIIHMNLKPANILLDSNMVPKITNFAFSRQDNISQTMSSEPIASLGLCAPEYLQHGKMSAKSDIYSLGVIILELTTGSWQKPNITKVQRRWKHRWNKTAKDAQLGYKQVAACLDLAGRCMQRNPIHRPDISDIIGQLNEMDSSDVETSDGTECMELEDMLGIEPLEIHLPFELNDQISCSVQLINDTDDHFAFQIPTTDLRFYCIVANRGTVPPRSKCSVTISMQALDKALPGHPYRWRDEFCVQSTRVDGSLVATNIVQAGGDIFDEESGKVIDTVNVSVILSEETSPSAGQYV